MALREKKLKLLKLNADLFAVKLARQYVEKYKHPEAFECLSEGDKGDLSKHIAPIIFLDDSDEYAKRFDNFMYGLMSAQIDVKPAFKYAKTSSVRSLLRWQRKPVFRLLPVIIRSYKGF